MVTVGSIIGGGFRLFREQPVAVLIWGVIYGLLSAGSSLLMASVMQGQLAAVQTGGGSPLAMFQWLIPFYLVMILIGLVMTAAAFRAVVRPEEKAAAFLRLGGDEARLLGLAIFWFVMNMVLYFAMAMLIGVAVAAIVAGGNASSPVTVILLGLLLGLPVIAVMVFLHIRLSPAIPLTLLRRQIVIGEAWRLTKGHFWTLFASYLVIVLILLAGYVLVASITMGSYWASVMAGGLTPQGMQAANQARFAQMSVIGPMMIIGWLINAVFGAVSYALWAGSVGTAALELVGGGGQDYAATFE